MKLHHPPEDEIGAPLERVVSVAFDDIAGVLIDIVVVDDRNRSGISQSLKSANAEGGHPGTVGINIDTRHP